MKKVSFGRMGILYPGSHRKSLQIVRLSVLILICSTLQLSATNINSSKNEANSAIRNNGAAQQIKVTGSVADKTTDESLVGVSITVKGTTKGTVADLNGKYSIDVPSANSVLVFSFIGYETQEIEVGGRTSIDVIMTSTSKNLQEVVVTALGIKKEQKALGYAVSTISAKDLTETGATNFASALYGKAAGVRINSAPGGASSAVNIQIRGASSIGNNTQPLYIVDGIPIRNSALLSTSGNNTDYWSESRIRENGALDLNPEDIETLSVLKGASASALYGSEATNAVIVITTKKGSKRHGIGVDFGYSYNLEKAINPYDYQNDYGPGYDRASNLSIGTDENGWITDSDGSRHPYYRSYCQFGPKFDGSTIKYWDGSTRKYEANKNNYNDFYQTGFSSTANIAISNASDNGSYRFSYSRTDYKGVQRGGNLEKNNFNFNGTLKLNDKISVDLVSTYNNTFTHNRPTMLSRLSGAYNGFFSRLDDMSTYLNKYQTTKGYKWVAYNQTQYDATEALKYNIRSTELLDLLWNRLKNSYDETQDRFINSVTLNLNLTNKLKLRGRIGDDFTSVRVEDKRYNEYPTAFGYSGYYGLKNGRYSLLYGDALATYTDKLTEDLGFTASAGFTGKKDSYSDASSGTVDGLVNENWFSLSNSVSSATTSATRKFQSYMAEFGILAFNYKSWLYLEGTGRHESTSTLAPRNNSYFYPSVNGSFVMSEALSLPSFISYAKIRASWAIVGNHPEMYQANVAYNQSAAYAPNGTALYQYAPSSAYGNDGIKSEKKYETEFGLETKMFNNRLGIDISYYNNKINNQILYLSTPSSSGATSMLSNVGDLTNQGIEVALNGTPIETRSFRWTTRFNFAINRNRLDRLTDGVDALQLYSADGGSLLIKASVGDALGDIYVHPIATNAKGEKIVNTDGTYAIDFDNYNKVGNVTPKVVGGFSNSFSYKNLSIDFMLDYRIGGQLVSTPVLYMTGAGMFKNSLQYRDAAHGGLSYNIDASGNKVLSSNGTYHDGIVLDGVTTSGAKNTTVVDAAYYYINSFGWGAFTGFNNQYDHAVFDNSYIKVREIAINYNLPKKLVSKMGLQNLQVSLMGRNLFYIWKTLENLDPETGVGSNWMYQGIDQGSSAPTRTFGAALRMSF
ncbi:MAG: SusC/RagA family TonB-linked outer membrane protein [Bacteroidota bacterium]|nr:SusC/RagA family TonB-linked outer membrane protein [Bacteroidota bacterium]